MDTEQEKRIRPLSAAYPFVQDGRDKTERFALVVGLGLAALTTVGALALAFYIHLQNGRAGEAESQTAAYGSEAVSVREAEAASMALAAGEEQSQGMTAPAEEVDTAQASAAAVGSTSAAPSEVVVAHDHDAAHVVVENGVVKFYFASGKADLAADALPALQDVAAGVKEGRKAVVAGYTDHTGNAEINERLSKARAFAVREALLSAGVPESRIELRKPESSTGTGSDREARRVEVVLE